MNVTVMIVCCCWGVCTYTGSNSDESEVESEEGINMITTCTFM